MFIKETIIFLEGVAPRTQETHKIKRRQQPLRTSDRKEALLHAGLCELAGVIESKARAAREKIFVSAIANGAKKI